jgi:hypothetical protein
LSVISFVVSSQKRHGRRCWTAQRPRRPSADDQAAWESLIMNVAEEILAGDFCQLSTLIS